MKRIKENNYLVIQGWMITELELSGNELLIYAIIYGFSQDGISSFNGSRQYLADFIGVSSIRTVDNALKGLIEKQLLVKNSEFIECSSQKKVSYRAIRPGKKLEKPGFIDWLNN